MFMMEYIILEIEKKKENGNLHPRIPLPYRINQNPEGRK